MLYQLSYGHHANIKVIPHFLGRGEAATMLRFPHMAEEHVEYEKLIESLCDDGERAAYREPFDHYRPSFVPQILAGLLVGCGNLLYGCAPSYQKFRALEIIARVPYHSWASATFTLLTLFYTDEECALRLSKIASFATFAAENETMHVVVISSLARQHGRAGFLRRTLIPVVFSFFYFWNSYLLYFLSPRWALEINYLFENHSFEQYSRFLKENERELRHSVIESSYLPAYGRPPRSQYEFFCSVRNDELVHRNRSVRELAMHRRAERQSEKGE